MNNEIKNNTNEETKFDPNAGDKMKVVYEVGINGENFYKVKPVFTNETEDGNFTTLDAIKSTAMINFSHLLNRVSLVSPMVEIEEEGIKKNVRKVTNESLDEGIGQYANFVAMRKAIELEWIENWLKNLMYKKELNIDEVTLKELMDMIKEII